jgi:hypothetical protein
MSDFNRGFTRPTPAIVDAGIDAGLRSFMLGVYNKVGLGLVLSAALAWVTGTYQPVQQLLFTVDPASGRMSYTILGMVVAFAPLAILLAQMFMRRTSPQWAAVTYWAIVSLIGASFGMLFMIYSDVSIFQTFLVTAAAVGPDLRLAGDVLLPLRGAGVRHQPDRRADLRGSDRLRHPAHEGDLLPAGRERGGDERGDQLRRAQPLPRLHQPVPLPALFHGRFAPLGSPEAIKFGPGGTPAGAFCFLRSAGPPRSGSSPEGLSTDNPGSGAAPRRSTPPRDDDGS